MYVNASRQRYWNQNDDQQLAFSMSIPLSRFLNNAWATYNVTNDSHGRTSQQAGVSGTLLKDRNLSYSVQESYTNQGTGDCGNASLSYLGGYGLSNVGYNYDDNQHQVTYGVSDDQHGVTLSQQLGDTVLPYVMPYRKNVISLDPSTLPNNVELEGSTKNVVPTQGAIVLASFNARTGYKALLTLRLNGKPVPFGATVQDTSNTANASFVGDNGQVYLSGLSESGHLRVQWGMEPEQQCQVNFTLPQDQMQNAMLLLAGHAEQIADAAGQFVVQARLVQSSCVPEFTERSRSSSQIMIKVALRHC